MPATTADPTLELQGLAALESAHAQAPSELEREVTRLFDLLRDRLLRYLLALGTPAQDGEEIIQEVVLALFQHLRRGRPRSNLQGWVFRVAHNLALKERQKNGQFLRARTGSAFASELECDLAPNPEEQLAAGQKRRRLLAVLRALPERDQSCLCLRAEGLRYREIALILGVSLGAVSLSLQRSLERLRRTDRG